MERASSPEGFGGVSRMVWITWTLALWGGREASEQESRKTGDLHVPDVVDVERLLQADNQPLESRLCKGK